MTRLYPTSFSAVERLNEQSELRAEHRPRRRLLYSGAPQQGEGTGSPKHYLSLLETPDPWKEVTEQPASLPSLSLFL